MMAHAQNGNAGTRGFEFLQIDNNARTVSMGGAGVAMPSGLYGEASNPASCGFITKTQAMLGYEKWIDDAWLGPMGYAMPYKNYGVLAASLLYMSHGNLDGDDVRDEVGDVIPDVKYHVFSLVGDLTWSKIVYDNLSIGLTMRGIHHSIGSTQDYYASTQGMAFSGGGQYRTMNSRFIIGAAIQNAGFIVSNYTAQSEKLNLPISATIGVSYVPRDIPGLRLACDFQKASDDYLNYKPGFEATIYKKVLFFRGGYSFSQADLKNVLKNLKGDQDDNYIKSSANGLSLGFGFITDIQGVATNIDVAYLGRVSGLSPSFVLTFLFEY
jgi:hypothetical protein